MTAVLRERPDIRAGGDGGRPAQRAMVHWAFRLFRREWRQQALILLLLVVAVAATTMGLGVVSNVTVLKADPVFGTANTIITIPGSDPSLSADLAAIEQRFGSVDVIAHQSVPVPGSVAGVDLRAQNPDGRYGHVTLRLDHGRYPTGPAEVAVTSGVASTFDLHVGSTWTENGRNLQVVGIVENPLDLQDEFALVAPGQANPPANVSVLLNASQSDLQSFRLPSRIGLEVGARGAGSKTQADVLVLVLGTLGLLFVGLMGVAGFTVMAQRRLRALGMVQSIGATDRHVRVVMLSNGAAVGATAAVVGVIVGFLAWIAFVPSMQSITSHRIDPFSMPWWAVGAAMLLTFVTSVVAAWWPARAVSRIPVVAALSGRPPRPQPAHRFATVGGVLLAAGLVLLAFADQHRVGFIIGGSATAVIGLLFLAPLAIRALSLTAARWPVSVKLALRDLGRYQARSGAALGAITLAIAIAGTIVIASATKQSGPVTSNLPSNQLVLYLSPSGGGGPTPPLTATQLQVLQSRVDQLAAALHAQTPLALEMPYNPQAPLMAAQPGPGGGPAGYPTVSLAQVSRSGRGELINNMVNLYVATPAVLQRYGIKADQIAPASDVVTSQSGLQGFQIFDPSKGPSRGGGLPPAETNPSIEILNELPVYSSDPTTLITPHAMQELGLQPLPAAWVIQTPGALTSAQINAARLVAARAGLYIETRRSPSSTAPLRNWSTTAGILLALGVLGMTVGLIRSETANDLRILTATGATSTTRRSLTGATAGALAFLGALIGTAGAYAALLVWYRSDLSKLGNVPIKNLVVILVGLPLIATVGGWLLSGREPSAVARRPIE